MGEGNSAAAGLVFGLLLLALGGIGVQMVVTDVTTYLDNTGSTETVQGTVVSEPSYFESGTDDNPEYTIRVEYRYTVEGRTYTGSTLWADGTNTVSSAGRADRFVRNHPANSTVTVHYVTGDPGRSYLLEGSLLSVLARDVVLVIFAPVLVGVGLVMLVGAVATIREGDG